MIPVSCSQTLDLKSKVWLHETRLIATTSESTMIVFLATIFYKCLETGTGTARARARVGARVRAEMMGQGP